jgi:formate dehydrogenase major subunit
MVLDPNVLIQEGKAGTCDVQPGRRPHGPGLLEYLREYRRRAGIEEGHQTPIITTDAVHESHRCGRPDHGA